ncbi:MAG: glycoside hydrolase family 3 C-terminal domain-containing protein [Deltaproteobacteria bacterium]
MQLPATGASAEEIHAFVDWCLDELSLDEKVYLMSGHGFIEQYLADDGQYNISPYQTGGGNERLGLPKLMFTDGPRGVALGNSTCFPVAMARGASWDVALEERIGEAIGREARAQGSNFFGGVCINLLRHPAWGRAQETYGEDPRHLGEMGAALVRGVQRHNVIATVKHFACNSIENARFKVDVIVGERELREVYLPHFKRCIDQGVASVMSAYNKVNGPYCGHNRRLLRTILKEEWGFEGFVHSDFVKGVYGPDAAAAGLDVENPETTFFGDKLVEAVERGEVPRADIDEAARRILTTLLTFETRQDPERYEMSVVACTEHRALAREAAEKSAVLLRNENGLLPLSRDSLARVAVVGPLADGVSLGDRGSSLVRPPSTVSVLKGLRNYVGDAAELLYDDGSDLDSAVAAAGSAGVTVVVVGYTHKDEGEFIPGEMSIEGGGKEAGGDRDSLSLSAADEALVLAVAAANARTVVVVIGGSAITMERWHHKVDAILMLWYPGMEGGHAAARLLFGEVSPSGKLPFTIPTDAAELPFFDKDAEHIEYGMYHGYTLFDHNQLEPAYCFGFGLSYTSFDYGPVRGSVDGEAVTLRCEVTNSGDRTAEEVVQCYVGFERSAVDRPKKLLRGFCKLALEPGQSCEVSFELCADDLAYFDPNSGGWTVEPISYTAWVAPTSAVTHMPGLEFSLGG